MSDGQMWVIGIIGVLLFLAVATTAGNITTLNNILKAHKPKADEKPIAPSAYSTSPKSELAEPLAEFGPQFDSFPQTFVNPANVVYLERLTTEGGTKINLLGGSFVHVYEDIHDVAKRLSKSMLSVTGLETKE